MYFGNQSGNIRKNNQISTNVYDTNNHLKEHMLTVRSIEKRNTLNAINLHSTTNIDTLGKKVLIDMDYFIYNSYDSINNYGNTFDGNIEFALNKKKTIILNAGFFYEFPYLAAYNRIEALCILYAGIKLQLFNENMTLSLTSNDILRTNHAKSNVISNNIRYMYDNYGDTQNIRLFVSYKLGNRNLRINKHNTSNTEEKERIK